jgi:hypothetical protein
MGLHAEDRKRHSDESHMSNLYRRRKRGLSKITPCFLKTRTFRGGREKLHCDRECNTLLGIAGNIRDNFLLTACEIRISANVRDGVMACVCNI